MKIFNKTLMTSIFLIPFLTAVTGCETTKTEPKVEIYVEPEEEQEPISFQATTILPETATLLLDDMEDGLYWYAPGSTWDSYGSHDLSLSVDLTKKWRSDKKNAMVCTMDKAGIDSSQLASWVCDSPLETDWSAYKYIAIDYYNPEDFTYLICFAAQTGVEWKLKQTDLAEATPGENTLLFNLSVFSRTELSNIQRMIIASIGENPGGTIYFDNIRLYK